MGPIGFLLLCLCVPVLPVQNTFCTTSGSGTVCQGEFTEFPEDIPTSVTNLDVSNNRLTSLEHNTLIKFVNIKKLNISRNLITNLHNRAFFRLTDLELLDLSFNNLIEISDKIIFNNVKLKWLSIAHNKNLKFIPHLLSKSLQKFNVSWCGIQEMNETTFQEVESIEILDLSFNEIKEIREHTFDALTLLYELDISNNKLQNAQFINSDCSLSLSYLDISSNNISVLDWITFQTLLSLKKIHFHNNPWRCDERMKSVYENMLNNETTLNLQCVSATDNKKISWHQWYYSVNQVSSCPVNSVTYSPTTCLTNVSRSNICPKVSCSCDTSWVGFYIIAVIICVLNVVFIVLILRKVRPFRNDTLIPNDTEDL